MMFRRVITGIFVLGLAVTPLAAVAVDLEPSPTKQLLITELQTTGKNDDGSSAATKEFIELYNTSEVGLDLSSIRLQSLSATGSTWLFLNPTVPVTGWLAPQDHLLLATTDYLAEEADFFYSAKLAEAGGHVRVVRVNPDDATVVLEVLDTLGWGTALQPETVAAAKHIAGQSLQRQIDEIGKYVDTDNNQSDFLSTITPDPQSRKLEYTPPVDDEDPPVDDGSGSGDTGGDTGSDSGDGDDAGETDGGSGDAGGTPAPSPKVLKPLLLSELLPNPASPQNDSSDEYVEMYNPNDEAVKLDGWYIETGKSFSYRVYLDGKTIGAGGFLTITSGETSLTLSNTAGAARLVDDGGVTISEADLYEEAKPGEAWAEINGVWQWTTTPTPLLPNVLTSRVELVSAPKVAAKKTAAKKATTSSAKTASAKTTSKKTTTSPGRQIFQAPPEDGQVLPVNPVVLATVGASALVYMVYEYRQDFRNRLQKLRRHRSIRRGARA
jgi:hypothetical protein